MFSCGKSWSETSEIFKISEVSTTQNDSSHIRRAKLVAFNNPNRVIITILIVWLLVGCAPSASRPTAVITTVTSTSVPPTDTPTYVSPKDTLTPVSPTGTSTPAYTIAASVDDIVGTWYSSFKNLYLRFYEDRLLHQAHSIDSLDLHPYAKCDIWFEDTQMYLKEKKVYGVPSCGEEIGIYEVRLYSEGTIQIVKVRDRCSPRAGDTALKLVGVP
jgi:hypothetical protein